MTPRLTLLITASAVLAACSSMPDHNAALDQARSRYELAQANPQVQALAADELKRADLALRTAQQALSDGQPLANVDHLAYLTDQRVTIAQDAASSRASDALVKGAAAERDRLRLAQRTSEVDAAQRKLGDAQQSNAQKTADLQVAQQTNAQRTAELQLAEQANARKSAELADADAAAQRAQAQVARRDARVSDLELQLQDMNMRRTERGIVVTLGDVLFDSGRAQLLPEAGRNMEKLAGVFRRDPARRASIEGYTDSVGDAGANVELSGRRANAVMGALLSLGVAPASLSIRAHGEAMPTASNGTAAGRQLNRRVEIVFVPQGDEMSMK